MANDEWEVGVRLGKVIHRGNLLRPVDAEDPDGEQELADVGLEFAAALPAESGSAAQVFEVTDLLIPAGTDWSSAPHEIGSFEFDATKGLVYSYTLELSAEIGAVDGLELVSSGLGGGALIDGSESASTRLAVNKGVYSQNTISANPAAFAPVTSIVAIDTFGPISQDITVVRARVAFLVI